MSRRTLRAFTLVMLTGAFVLVTVSQAMAACWVCTAGCRSRLDGYTGCKEWWDKNWDIHCELSGLVCGYAGGTGSGGGAGGGGGAGDADYARVNFLRAQANWDWLANNLWLTAVYMPSQPGSNSMLAGSNYPRTDGDQWATGAVFYNSQGKGMTAFVMYGVKSPGTTAHLMRGNQELARAVWTDQGNMVLSVPGGPAVCPEPYGDVVLATGLRVVKNTFPGNLDPDVVKIEDSIKAQMTAPDPELQVVYSYDTPVPDAPTPTLPTSWGKLQVIYR